MQNSAINPALPPIFSHVPRVIYTASAFSTFPVNTFLENIAVDAAGSIFVTSMEEGTVYRLDPRQDDTDAREIYARTDGKIAGIIHLSGSTFLLNGWDARGIPTIYLLTDRRITPLHQPEGAQFLNGMTALNDRFILLCDSYKGCLWIYDLQENRSAIWLQHPFLEKGTPDSPLPAANGIKVHQGHVYVSNTEKQLLIRIPLLGQQPGEPEIFLRHVNLDDFAFDQEDNVYAATHIYNSVIRITRQKEVTIIGEERQGLAGSTAVAFGRTALDNNCLYVTTNGGMSLPPEGGVQPARLIRIQRLPSPYEWAGGVNFLQKLVDHFYEKVLRDDLLEPLFRRMSPEHTRHVAHFFSEVFQGPGLYSEEFGKNAMHHMIGKHVGKHLTEAQRKRWVELLTRSADELGLPSDPEFRATFAGHLEWGSRLALLNSHASENPATDQDHLPHWGWGEVNGPFEVVGSLLRQRPEQ